MGNTYISCFYAVHSIALYIVFASCTDMGVGLSVILGNLPMFILCNASLSIKHSEILDCVVISLASFIEGFLVLSVKDAPDVVCILSGLLFVVVHMGFLIMVKRNFKKVKK